MITNKMIILASRAVSDLLTRYAKGEYWYVTDVGMTPTEKLESETIKIFEAAFKDK